MTQPNPTQTQPDAAWSSTLALPLATLGAVLGAAVGAFIFKWGYQSHFYIIPLVGMLAGWGSTLFAPRLRGGWTIGILAGLITIAVELWAEWNTVNPFRNVDDSFVYFVRHVTELAPFRLCLHALGAGIAVWFAGRKQA